MGRVMFNVRPVFSLKFEIHLKVTKLLSKSFKKGNIHAITLEAYKTIDYFAMPKIVSGA